MTTKLIAADMPIDERHFPVDALLQAFDALQKRRPDVRLALTGKRAAEARYSVWNFLDERGLTGKVEFLPYYDRCVAFPGKKETVDVWVERDIPASRLTETYLQDRLNDWLLDQPTRRCLFVSPFHPGRYEGNGRLMRHWISQFGSAGYEIDVVYYATDAGSVTQEARARLAELRCRVHEISVESPLAGMYGPEIVCDVDDWVGPELIAAVDRLVALNEYDVALVNYVFMSAVFERVAAYTKRILLTHDVFADRNQRLVSEGFSNQYWISLDQEGERRGCRRADIVVALQEEESAYFRTLMDDQGSVVCISPVFEKGSYSPSPAGDRLRIGFFGSNNSANESNFKDFLEEWAARPWLADSTEIVVAGGMCQGLPYYIPHALLKEVGPRLLGTIADLATLFSLCDIIVNPERGGTGIKIKCLETLAHGAPLLTTVAGAVGLGSSSRFHQCRDAKELVELIEEIARDRSLLDTIATDSAKARDDYVFRHAKSMLSIMGSRIRKERLEPTTNRQAIFIVPDYVRDHASDYQISQVRAFLDFVNIRGKRIIEIGSDYHCAVARLFAANGAAHVLTTNLSDWRSSEPLPENVEFHGGDFGDLPLEEHSVDFVFGIAVLEHIQDFSTVAVNISRVLKLDGLAFLQGYPLWPGPIGHHVYVSDDPGAGTSGQPRSEKTYKFNDPDVNPVPDWAHLVLRPMELVDLLVERGVGSRDSELIRGCVYNEPGAIFASGTNFASASQIVRAFDRVFPQIFIARESGSTENAYFYASRDTYSADDLHTAGLTLWLPGPESEILQPATYAGCVSIVIPFFNVEPWFVQCLESVVDQDYQNLEIILVDDASLDGSRSIAENFVARDPRICIVSHDLNQGLGPARNTGALIATGDYLFFLDSDDFLYSRQAISDLIKVARSKDCEVVVGKSVQEFPDGHRFDCDSHAEKECESFPDVTYHGEAAFNATKYQRGCGFIPVRAWGALIARRLFIKQEIFYPPGEHEDMAVTPFLYFKANSVYYSSHHSIVYRMRAAGLSSTVWSRAKVLRYAQLWQNVKANANRCGLSKHVPELALKHSVHLAWKLQTSDVASDVNDAVGSVFSEILADADASVSSTCFDETFWRIRQVCASTIKSTDDFRLLYGKLSPEMLLNFFSRSTITMDPKSGSHADHTLANGMEPSRYDYLINQARVARIYATYEQDASAFAKNFPAMLTYSDRAMYFWIGRHHRFRGVIVDGGCFIGGTTTNISEGLRHNPLSQLKAEALNGLIRVYDLFRVSDDYVLHELRKIFPGEFFEVGSSFEPLFQRANASHREFLSVISGDVTAARDHDEAPIETLGLDLCKNLAVTDHCVRRFFPRLMPGALVVHQDFIHEWHPYLHLSMIRLGGHFQQWVEFDGGGSVVFQCIKPITRQDIERAFGTDMTWFEDFERNEALLRVIERRMLFDQNIWMMILVRCMYCLYVGRIESARTAFEEARARFPDREIAANVISVLEAH